MKKITLLFVMAASLILNANAGNKVGTKENTGKVKSEAAAVATYTLSGAVLDQSCGEVLAGATITVDGKKYYSDLSGNFNIPQLNKGKHTLSVDFISYQSQTMEIDVDKNEEIKVAIKQL